MTGWANLKAWATPLSLGSEVGGGRTALCIAVSKARGRRLRYARSFINIWSKQTRIRMRVGVGANSGSGSGVGWGSCSGSGFGVGCGYCSGSGAGI